MAVETKHYKRVMLKLSGEALANDKGFGIEPSPALKSLLSWAAAISGAA